MVQSFLEAVGGRGMGALELVAMDMKARGMYVCRTLSFSGWALTTIESKEKRTQLGIIMGVFVPRRSLRSFSNYF